MELSPLPGFRDFYPEEAARRDYILATWSKVAERYGFVAYDSAPLESIDLFKRKSGEEIVKQLYCFTDKGDREISLRPEITPSLARMIASKGSHLPKPLKWYAHPQLFRYERQQRGRLREFYQLNCDILGETGVAADAEMVALLIDTLRAFRLTQEDFQVHVSDRPLLSGLIKAIGIVDEELTKKVFACIDKLAREPREKIHAKLVEAGLSGDQPHQVLDLFQKQALSELASQFDSNEAVCKRILELQHFFGILDSIGLGSYVRFDLTVVRGLAYYTGIVYEAFDIQGELRAICGGGRYDQLVSLLGGVDMPALGFGMGDVVLGELLTARNLWPITLQRSIDLQLVLVDESLRSQMLALAHSLREKGLRVDYPLTETAVGKQFKQATQRQAVAAAVLGPDEWKRGMVKWKHLMTREEIEIPVDKILGHTLEILQREC